MQELQLNREMEQALEKAFCWYITRIFKNTILSVSVEWTVQNISALSTMNEGDKSDIPSYLSQSKGAWTTELADEQTKQGGISCDVPITWIQTSLLM